MLNQVTWTAYWTALLLSSCVYYVTIAFLYYRDELLGILRKRTVKVNGASAIPVNSPVEPAQANGASVQPVNDEQENLYHATNTVMQDLQSVFDKDYSRPELLTVLRSILQGFPQLIETPYQQTVNQYIVSESKKCSVPVHLSEDDLRGVWMR